MRRRLGLALTAAVLLVALGGVRPADAGTTVKDRPSGLGVQTVGARTTSPPMGVWLPVNAWDPANPSDICRMEAKWGNFQPENRGFVQYRQVGGQHCSWGGINQAYLYDGTTAIRSPGGSDNQFCTADPSQYHLSTCIQLADGSILLGPHAGNNRPIIEAHILTCWGVWAYGVLERRCYDDRWQVNF